MHITTRRWWQALQPVYNLLGTEDLSRFRTLLADNVSLKNHMMTTARDVAPYIKAILDRTCAPVYVCYCRCMCVVAVRVRVGMGALRRACGCGGCAEIVRLRTGTRAVN
jgi:hypothetical protein